MGLLTPLALLTVVALTLARPGPSDDDLRAVLAQFQLSGDKNILPLADLQPARVDTDPAKPCNPKKCKLPNCRCSGSDIPGGLKRDEVPQMVVLTFQNAVNPINYGKYMQLMAGRTNPNGCPFSGTFFVQHNYTDYYQVQSLYAARQEIADNTVTFPSSSVDWGKQLQSQKTILSQWGGIAAGDIQGVRAPNLAPGGNAQIAAMVKAKLSYDSSRTTVKYIDSPGILWPYTYDFTSTQDCPNPTCPTASFPGVWEVPIMTWECQGARWATPQSCQVNNATEAFWLLYNKYQKHVTSSNRAPLTIVMDSAWLVTDYKLQGTLAFMHVLSLFHNDTYVVSAGHALEWIRNPTRLSKLASFKPWQCSGPPPKVCGEAQARMCLFDAKRRAVPREGPTVASRMRTCQTCPACYPGLDDPMGRSC